MQKFFLLLFGSILVAGCAAPYQGMNGGYIEIPGPGKLDKVSFLGIVYIEPSLVQDNVIYRAAEIAKSKNKPYFVMYRTLTEAALDVPASSPVVGWMGMKPSAYVFVLCLDESRPGAQKASTVLTQLQKVVHPNSANHGKGGTK